MNKEKPLHFMSENFHVYFKQEKQLLLVDKVRERFVFFVLRIIPFSIFHYKMKNLKFL